MKTIKLLFVSAVLVLSSFAVQAQVVEVKSNYFDAWVDQTGFVNAYGDNNLINNGGELGDNLNSVVMNFLLPAIPEGTVLLNAEFTASSVRKDAGVNSNADLYGINFRAGDAALGTDYYSGPFIAGANVGNGSDWGIMDNMFATTDANGNPLTTTKTTDAAANIQLMDFIKKQYTDGGVNKYAFLRLSLDNTTSALWQRYAIASEANTTLYPRLTLTFGANTGINSISANNIKLYSSASKNIVVESEDIAGSILEVYSLSGNRLLSQKINETKFVSSEVFQQGSYLIKLVSTNGKSLSQVFIVK